MVGITFDVAFTVERHVHPVRCFPPISGSKMFAAAKTKP
jgi:hypothetical protein